MLSPKRISLLLAVMVTVSVLVVLATTLSLGLSTPATNPRISVLRRKDQVKVRPRPEEIAAFQDGKRERTFKTRDFKDMPLAIRKVRNLDSDTWHKDLGIEVKNVSAKPIYFILAYLQFPDDPAPGNGISGITLTFGLRKNIDVSRIADPEDPHLKPGETVVLTIAEQYRKGLQIRQERHPEMMKKFEFHFGLISFGDGTGFETARPSDYRIKKSRYSGKRNHHSNRPASSIALFPPQDGCGSCARYVINPEPFQICWGQGNPCVSQLVTTSPNAPCRLARAQWFDCDGDDVKECHDDEIYQSPECPGYSPTPTPSPSPSPSPSPTCNPNDKPNDSNCYCAPEQSGGSRWVCGCIDGSEGADNHNPALINGCPPGKIRDGDCCVCSQPETCDPGCNWDTYYCRCVDFVGQPCSGATPNPNPQPGSGGGSGGYTRDPDSCTEYWWVEYDYWGGGWHEVGRNYAGCW